MKLPVSNEALVPVPWAGYSASYDECCSDYYYYFRISSAVVALNVGKLACLDSCPTIVAELGKIFGLFSVIVVLFILSSFS